MDIQRAINWLIENEGFRLPHGVIPGSRPGGQDTDFDEERWNQTRFNPPSALPDLDTLDPNASPKPTWARLVEVDGIASLAGLRDERVYQANAEATRRIAVNYHPMADMDRNKEWQVRFSGDDLTAENAERARLVTVCHNIETRIAAATTEAELNAIDPFADSEWAAG